MQTTRLKLVTIIMEAVLEDQILDDIRDLGATGYTLVARGGLSREPVTSRAETSAWRRWSRPPSPSRSWSTWRRSTSPSMP